MAGTGGYSSNWEASRAKTSRYDTEHERRPVRPDLAPPSLVPQKAGADNSFVSDMANMHTGMIMEQAIKDRTAQMENEGHSFNAKQFMAEQEANDGAKQEEDEDRDGAKADEDDDLEALRARRRKQMKEAQDKRQKNAALGHGSYDEIKEDEFLKTVTASQLSIVHFYHRHFEKCKLMDMHLGKMSKKFFNTRFVKLDAEKAHFFVAKLAVKTLPCAIVFVDGVAKGRQIGFEGLGGTDDFSTAELAWRFKEMGGIEEDFDQDEQI